MARLGVGGGEAWCHPRQRRRAHSGSRASNEGVSLRAAGERREGVYTQREIFFVSQVSLRGGRIWPANMARIAFFTPAYTSFGEKIQKGCTQNKPVCKK